MALRLSPNLHSLYMSGMYPLGIECFGCKRRALVLAGRLGGCKGGMTEIRSLRLVCSSCGARDWEAKVFLRAGEAEAWVGPDRVAHRVPDVPAG